MIITLLKYHLNNKDSIDKLRQLIEEDKKLSDFIFEANKNKGSNEKSNSSENTNKTSIKRNIQTFLESYNDIKNDAKKIAIAKSIDELFIDNKFKRDALVKILNNNFS